MGLLKHLRSLEPAHRTAELLRALEKPRPLRTVLYLNNDRIESVFAQEFAGLLTASRSGSTSGTVTIGGFGAGGEVGRDRALQETIGFPAVNKLFLLEEAAVEDGKLVEIGYEEPRDDALLLYRGAGQFFLPNELVAVGPLDGEAAAELQAWRTEQEAIMGLKGEDARTVVFVGSGDSVVCAICSIRWIELGSMASYSRMPAFSMLGLSKERPPSPARSAVHAVSPLAIWIEH